jgi:hypothetical protein
MSDSSFGTWTVPESPVDIEYSMSVIEEIRQAVAEGFQRLSRGGIEVGGVLYGSVVGRRLRIMAVREIACEHARGPTFHLSENDRELLRAQLERERDDPRLSGMGPVGWYLSHTRSEITLQESDLDTYNTFFPQPWQVTMVIRPVRSTSMRAGFFVREADGTVKTDQSYQDFDFPDRLAGMFDRPPREHGAPPDRGAPPERRGGARLEPGIDLQSLAEELSPRQAGGYRHPVRPEPEYSAYTSRDVPSPAAESPGQEAPAFAYPPSLSAGSLPATGAYRPAPRKFPWTAIAVLAVAVLLALAGLRYFGPHLNAEPLGLLVSERDGQLQIQWNHASRSITGATSATIEIADGTADKQNVVLTPPQLASGNLTYARRSADVQVRMRVNGPAGAMEEGSRFLGGTPEAGNGREAELTKAQRDELQDEVERLRDQNSQQAQRIQRLERTLTILRSRLGIADSAR